MQSPPKTDHPFFWAGFLLADTGAQPQKDGEDPAAGIIKNNAAPANPAAAPAVAPPPAAVPNPMPNPAAPNPAAGAKPPKKVPNPRAKK